MHELLQLLSGGDRRSIGRANAVAALVLDQPALLGVLFDGLATTDPVLRMRCADAAEKVTAMRPDYLVPYKGTLIEQLCGVEQQEVRWHLAPMLARLPLAGPDEALVLAILRGYTKDRSSIVKTAAMQALADLAVRSPRLRAEVLAPWKEHLFHAKTQRRKVFQCDISVVRFTYRVTGSSPAKFYSSLRSWRLCVSNCRF